MIPQSLKLNIRFLKKLVIWTFEIFVMMHESALSRQHDTGNLSIFTSHLGKTLMMRLITTEKYPVDSIFWYDPLILKLSLFAKFKERPLSPK